MFLPAWPLPLPARTAIFCGGVALAALVTWSAPAQAAYTVNADGTVIDTSTGLVWDQCVLGSRTSVATSCATNTNDTYTWVNALAQVTVRNTVNHLGYSDWRLPNINELESLVDLSVASGAKINTTAFPDTPISGDEHGAGHAWSATTSSQFANHAWSVSFDLGRTQVYHKTGSFLFVRLVRSGQSFSTFDKVGAANYTAPTPSGSSTSGNVTTALAGGGAGCALGSVAYQSASSVGAAPPAGVSFPFGLVNFTTTACAVGGTVTITLTYPSALPAGAQFYKYGPPAAGQPASWYVHPATIVGNTITYSVTDGGQGDSSPAAGVITDPGGPGVGGAGAGGAGMAGVPTLSQWALLLLVGLMGWVAVGRNGLPRRR